MGMHSILLAKSFDLDGFSMWSEDWYVAVCVCLCIKIHSYIIIIHTLLHVSMLRAPCSVLRGHAHAHERACAHDKLYTMTYLAKREKKTYNITSMEFWKRNSSHISQQNHTILVGFRFHLCMRIL